MQFKSNGFSPINAENNYARVQIPLQEQPSDTALSMNSRFEGGPVEGVTLGMRRILTDGVPTNNSSKGSSYLDRMAANHQQL